MSKPTTFLPELPAAGYPKADACLLGGSHRVYLFDVDTRKELTAHPLNGARWSGTGPMCSLGGQYVERTSVGVDVCAYLEGRWVEVRITADSFPGRRVAAKVWHPEHPIDWRMLAGGDGSHVPAYAARLPTSALKEAA